MRGIRALAAIGLMVGIGVATQAQVFSAAPVRLVADAVQAEDVEISAFGSYIAIYDASEGNTLRMFSSDLEEIWRKRLPFYWAGSLDAASVIEFSSDETRVLFPGGRTENDVCVCDSETGEILHILRGHENDVNVIALSPDGSRLVTASYNEIALWQRAGDTFELTTIEEFGPSLKAAEFLPDNRRLVLSQTSSQTRSIVLVDTTNGSFERLDDYSFRDNNISHDIYEISVSPDGELVAGGYRERIIVLQIGANKLNLETEINGISSGNTYAVRFTPSGNRLVGAHFRFVTVWNREEEWREEAVVSTQQPSISDLEISRDGRRLLVATTGDENAIAEFALEGVSPSPLGRVAESFGSATPLSVVRTLDERLAADVVGEIPPALFAPRDMFETADEYERRVAQRSAALLGSVYDLVEIRFGAERVPNPDATHDLLIPLDAQGTYNVDRSLYSLPVLGATATVEIDRNAARSLFQNWASAYVRVTRFESGGTPDFADFRLMHPTNATAYPVQFRENPFTGESMNMAGRRIAAIGVGAHITIRDLRLFGVFPALYQQYESEAPFGSMTIANTGTGIISDLTVAVAIDGVTTARRELDVPRSLSSGQEIAVALNAGIRPSVLESEEGSRATMELDVSYRRGSSAVRETIRQQIRVLNRNAIQWTDDERVGAFMTVADPEILRFAGSAAAQLAVTPTAVLTRNILYAMHVVESVRATGMRYVIDPNSAYASLSEEVGAVDYLRFPTETLAALAGDCDDLSVLTATLLESVGVPTAYITTPGHIFIAFDTGIETNALGRTFSSEADLINREGRVWMPIEMTTGEGFVRAWQTGALQWRQAAEADVAGWFTSERAWSRYTPVAPPLAITVDAPASDRIVEAVGDELDEYRTLEMQPRLAKILEESNGKEQRIQSNRLGILYATYGLLGDAASAFEAAAAGEYVPGLVNLANVLSIDGDHDAARAVLERARAAEPENARVLLGLAFSYWESGNQSEARDTYAAASRISPTLARRYPLFDAAGNGTRASSGGPARLFTDEWSEESE